MRIRSLIGASLLAAGLFAANGASAQGIIIDEGGVRIAPPAYDRGDAPPPRGGWDRGDDGYYQRGIGPREARRIARSAGLIDTYGVDRRGPVWIVEGADRRGWDLRVVISARSGDIINVDRAPRG